MITLPPYIIYLLSFICALSASIISVPRIIHVSKRKKLFDIPDNKRKIHLTITPNLGGVGIFFAYIIVTSLFITSPFAEKWNYIIASSVILFLTGINDDLVSLGPGKKFLAQFIAAIITVCLADVRINSLHGILGIYQMPYWYSVSFTIIGVIFITNAFNLIDGIDGLAGVTGIIANLSFAALFFYIHQYEFAVVSLILVGSIFGFLRYNITPAKIFMGDTGSLFIGLISVVLAIKLIELTKTSTPGIPPVAATPALTVAILIVPVFDTIRIFFIRILNGISPFKADRNHIHHRILRLGYTHFQTTIILSAFNLLCIVLALTLGGLGNFALIGVIFAICILFNWSITFALRSKERETVALRNLFV